MEDPIVNFPSIDNIRCNSHTARKGIESGSELVRDERHTSQKF